MVFSQAVSGLNAAATNLNVIGNNIANSAAYGFKSGTASFVDMFADSKVGLGVKIAGTTQDFADGTTASTGRGLDVVVSQNGFFRMISNNGSVFYSRNGRFKLNENHSIVNMQGLQLAGYPATGTPPAVQQGADPASTTIPSTLMAAKSTTTASMQANLNSTDRVPTEIPFNPSNVDSCSREGSITVFDSRDNTHDMNIFYVKNARSNAQKIFTQDVSTGEPAGSAGFMQFSRNDVFLGISATVAGAPAGTDINIIAGEISGVAGTTFSLSFLNSVQQNTGANSIVATNQNGYKPGDLVSYQISNDGAAIGNYSNEQQQVLGRIVSTDFASNGGLTSQGDSVWAATQSSGVMLLGTTGEGNFDKLTNGALETSNVDLNKELMNVIAAQRNYQLNAQTIEIQNQILSTLVSLR